MFRGHNPLNRQNHLLEYDIMGLCRIYHLSLIRINNMIFDGL